MQTRVHTNGRASRTIVLPSGTPGRRSRREVIAGALLNLTAIAMILSIITNEALYPAARHYNTFANSISDLGGTEPPNSYIVEPNRWIFIATMALCGVLVLIAAHRLASVVQRRRFVVALAIFGTGLVGIAVFPGNVAGWHPLFSFVCFIGGSVAAILSRKELVSPIRYFAVASGRSPCSRPSSGSNPSRTGGRRRRSAAAAWRDGSPTRCSCGSCCSVLSS